MKIKKMLTFGLTTSMVLGPFLDIVNAQQLTKNNTTDNSLNSNDSKNEELYLSDIDFDKRSTVGYGSIRNDVNTAGNKIKLIVDGEPKEFEKGVSAHAPSSLIYDVSSYSKTYPRLTGYVGVDNSQSGRGDGVIFTVYTSEDGENWNLVQDIGLLTADKESKYIDINLKGAKYVKIYANENSYNGNDHAVYGDLKLVKDNYTISKTKIEGLYPVSCYDSILSNETIDKNIKDNQMIILRRAFVSRAGYESLQRLCNKGQKYVDGISYLLKNETALRYFITNGPINVGGSYQKSIQAFCDIYSKYKDELSDTADNNFNLRLATSISLAYSRKEMVTSWMDSNKPMNAANRYNAFKTLINTEKIDIGGQNDDYGKWSSNQFKQLPIPLMRWTVDTRMNDDEILWLADYLLNEKKSGKNYLSVYNYIHYTSGYNYKNEKYYNQNNYTKYNNKYNFSKYYNDYGDKNVCRIWMAFEEGGVCGTIANISANIAEVLGRPSSPCGQPGHASNITLGWHTTNKRYEWMLENDASGWVQTGNQYDDRMLGWGNQKWSNWYNASYVVLATDAIYDSENFEKATMLNLLADSYTDNNTKKQIYEKALKYQKINLDSLEGLVNCYKANESTTSSQYFELCTTIIDAYTYYPQAMMELLALIEDNVTNPLEVVQLDVLKFEALTKASKATTKESTNVNACTQLARHYLSQESSSIATFSFDGENKNKIILNDKYKNLDLTVRYSLDGGRNWTQTNDKVITLTQYEINKINPNDDIKIEILGTSSLYTIDILPGNTLSASSIYVNDKENKLMGAVDGLEISTDRGQNWRDYISGLDSGVRFRNNTTVKARYKAHGVHVSSNIVDFKFTKDTDTKNRKYVQLKNVKTFAYSNQQDNTSHAASNLIDGNINTSWHTVFGQTTQDKYYAVEFDKVRNINSIEYESKGYNGKLKSGEIYTSLDGETWTLSGEFNNLANDHTTKTLDLNSPTPCKYLAIVATETHGNTVGERDMYMSGNMLNFYEDTTYKPNNNNNNTLE